MKELKSEQINYLKKWFVNGKGIEDSLTTAVENSKCNRWMYDNNSFLNNWFESDYVDYLMGRYIVSEPIKFTVGELIYKQYDMKAKYTIVYSLAVHGYIVVDVNTAEGIRFENHSKFLEWLEENVVKVDNKLLLK